MRTSHRRSTWTTSVVHVVTLGWLMGCGAAIIGIVGGHASRPAMALSPSPSVVSVPDSGDLPLLVGDDDRLTGTSGLTAADIDAILASYRSPATGSGVWFIDGERRYRIDAAYALAVFIHESRAGTDPAWAGRLSATETTHNIGNIICTPGYPHCAGRFRRYGSWREGIADWFRLIAVEYRDGRGITTMHDVIPIYAPASENDVDAYRQAVRTLVTTWRATYGAARLQASSGR